MPAFDFKDTLDSLIKAWQLSGESSLEEIRSDLPKEDLKRVRRLMAECIEARGGEVSARSRAASLGRLYLRLDREGKTRFLSLLACDFTVDRTRLSEAVNRYQHGPSLQTEERLRKALVSPRQKLLKQFNALHQGVKFLIDLRADLLPLVPEKAEFRSLDHDLKSLLATWFDIGFLELHHITWDSSAALLEKLIAYEAVHQIHSWEDLRNRLESDRRCYAFFHPAMPEEPLIFIEVALVEGIAGSIQALLDRTAPKVPPAQADTAIFYSISNAQKGLRGISFGNFLIKRVVDDLSRELPGLKTFATLSPIPGFAHWLKEHLGEEGGRLAPELKTAIASSAARLGVESSLETVLAHPDWPDLGELCELLHRPLEQLCALYFHQTRPDGVPLDPVERFHLGNGARIERINWLGDTSAKGLKQSYGLMVNYLYRLKDIEKNHEAYATGKRIACVKQVRALLKEHQDTDHLMPLLGRIFSGK